MKREKEIKGWKSRLKIQKLISTEYLLPVGREHPDYNWEGFRFES